MTPAVTIILPAYNAAGSIGRTLDSVDAQRHDGLMLQLIIIDDGSDDETGAIADSYAAAHPDTTVIHTPNGGISTARNTALQHATGRWITFVDSDDVLVPDTLAALVRHGEDTGADIVQGVMSLRGTRVKSRGRVGNDKVCTLDAETAMGHILTEKIFTTAQGRLYRRDIYGDIRFPDGLFFEDVIWTATVVSQSRVYAVVNTPFYVYHYQNGSITSRITAKHLDLFTTLDMRMELVSLVFPRLVPAATRLTFYNASRVRSYARDQKADCLPQIEAAYNRLTDKYRAEIDRYVPRRLRLLYTNAVCDFCYTTAGKIYRHIKGR